MALSSLVDGFVFCVGNVPKSMLRPGFGGAEGNRTPDLDIANVALSQLSYGPLCFFKPVYHFRTVNV